MSKVSMKGVIDMHVHTNPDLRLRAYDDFEMMEAGIRVGARAIVLKTHQGTTMDRAYLCNRHNEIVHGKTNNFTMFGSITLNKVVGGINPKAVDVALKLGAKASDPVSQEPYGEKQSGSGGLRGRGERRKGGSGAERRVRSYPGS